MRPEEFFGVPILSGDPAQPSAEQIALYREQQRMAHIEMYRQATAQQCLVALIVKSMREEMDGESVSVTVLAKRAKKAADALCTEFFGEESLTP